MLNADPKCSITWNDSSTGGAFTIIHSFAGEYVAVASMKRKKETDRQRKRARESKRKFVQTKFGCDSKNMLRFYLYV